MSVTGILFFDHELQLAFTIISKFAKQTKSIRTYLNTVLTYIIP